MVAVSIDGRLVAGKDATISVFDRGLLYGDGCFEVLRTWAGVAVDLAAHLDRLLETAEVLALRTLARSAIARAVADTVRAAGQGEHRIRIVLTRGAGALGTAIAELGPGRCCVIVEPLPPPPTGVSAVIVDWPLPRRTGRGHKTLAYLDHVIARELARAGGADEALRLDATGHVAEGATSNLFIVTDGAIATPPIEQGVLPGIVRGRVLELGASLGIPAAERPLTFDAVAGADELFVTSSLRGVVPVTRFEGAPRPDGPVTARIASAYATEMQRRATGSSAAS